MNNKPFSNDYYKNVDNLAKAANQFADIIRPISEMANSISNTMSKSLTIISEFIKPAIAFNKLSEAQFVWNESIPRDYLDEFNGNNTDRVIEKYFATDEWLEDLINQCGLSENNVFSQALKAFYNSDYNVAILGFVAVFDRILADCSGIIDITSIKKRADVLTSKLDKGDFDKLDEIEEKDFVLYYTYSKAIVLFDDFADFKLEEPGFLNRHWIMHGRSNKEYSRLDCIKVLSMINGTKRIAELGKTF